MFGLLKNTCNVSIISISQVVKLSQKDSFLAVPDSPKKSSRPEIRPQNFKETYFEFIPRTQHADLFGVFFWKTELCKEKIISLSANKIWGEKVGTSVNARENF